MKLEEGLRERLAALVEGEGLTLAAVELSGSGPKTVLRLVIDGVAGVNLDQCASISRMASAVLDVEDPFSHRYTLEVSSPGLDRKLYSSEDYQRFAGRQVKIRMQPSFREHRTVVGKLLGLEGATVKVEDASGVKELPLGEVFETRLDIDWKAILKEGKSRP
jgi:ribosome maturation factor RimP